VTILLGELEFLIAGRDFGHHIEWHIYLEKTDQKTITMFLALSAPFPPRVMKRR
jgi:hypothetical protein